MQSDEKMNPEVERDGKQNQANRPNVVVLGAGFGGLWAARTLAEGPINLTLVDRRNYHTFIPLLYQVGAALLDPEDIAQPLREVFWNHKNVHFFLGEVQQIEFSAKVVRLKDHELHYDYLVFALGSRPFFFGTPGAAENAFTLKTLDQAIVLRNQILTCFERAASEDNSELRQARLTFTIIGGGPSGVEFAGALRELIKGSLDKDFPDLDFKQVRVVLLEAADHLLEGLPKELGDYTRERLTNMGVEVRLKSQVVAIHPDEVLLKDGSRISTETVIWTAGVHGNIPGNPGELATNRRNQAAVLPTLQVPDHPEVYIIGDSADIQQNGHPLPMVAQVAMQSGTTAGRNILRQIQGQAPVPFQYRDLGTLDVIGRNSAVASIWGRSFHGFSAWVIWVAVHIFNLIGFRNRLLVMINWAWDYLFSEHGVRLIVPSNFSLLKETTPASSTPAKEEQIPASDVLKSPQDAMTC